MLKVKGFTLIELLIALVIIGVAISATFPTLTNIIANNKLTIQHNNLIRAISLTRSEAIKRGQRVSLCQSSDMLTCTKDSANWNHGWVIFVDSNEDNQIDSADSILRVQQKVAGMNISFGARTRISYHPDGIAVGASNGTFLFCYYR